MYFQLASTASLKWSTNHQEEHGWKNHIQIWYCGRYLLYNVWAPAWFAGRSWITPLVQSLHITIHLPVNVASCILPISLFYRLCWTSPRPGRANLYRRAWYVFTRTFGWPIQPYTAFRSPCCGDVSCRHLSICIVIGPTFNLILYFSLDEYRGWWSGPWSLDFELSWMPLPPISGKTAAFLMFKWLKDKGKRQSNEYIYTVEFEISFNSKLLRLDLRTLTRNTLVLIWISGRSMISKNRCCILHDAGGTLPCVSYSKMPYSGDFLPYRPLKAKGIFTRLSPLNDTIKRLPSSKLRLIWDMIESHSLGTC